METPATKKSSIPKRTLLIATAIILPVVGWVVWDTFFDVGHRPILVTGTIQAKEIPVASKVGGRIATVFVEEGQTVTKGQPLVEFEVPELDARREQLSATIKNHEALLEELKFGPRKAEIEKARATVAEANANWLMLKQGYRKEEVDRAQDQREEAEHNLSLLKNGYRMEEIEAARFNMEQARAQLEFAKKDSQRYSDLATQGAVSAREADDLKSRFDVAREALASATEAYKKMKAGPRKEEIAAARERLSNSANQEKMMLKGPRSEEIEMSKQRYLSAKASLKLLEEGTRKEQIAQEEANLAQARATLKELEAQLRDRQVLAPAEAEISVMDLHAGQIVSANKSLATLTRLDDLWTRVYLPERELARVHMGQVIKIKADAFPSRSFDGKIVQIPSVAEFTPRNVQTAEERSAQVFGLKIKIDNKERLLRGGMNAEITLPPVQGPFTQIARKENAIGNRP